MRDWPKAATIDPTQLRPDGCGGSRSARDHPPHAQALGQCASASLIGKLEQGIARLAARQDPFKDMSMLYPTLRMTLCEHHYVFCLPREDAPALILAILHERRDLMTRLADRLKG